MSKGINKKIIFIGAPGSGKGTYTKILKPILDVKSLSIGKIVRNEIKKNTPVGIKCKIYNDRGELIPDKIVDRIVFNELEKPKYWNGFICDGYPRNVEQAKTLSYVFIL